MRHQTRTVRRNHYVDLAPSARHLQGDPPKVGPSASATRRIPARGSQAARTSGPPLLHALSGLVALAGFVAAAVAEHVLNPHLDPATHEISEYAKPRTGWVMTVGFALWALSMVFLAWAVVTAHVPAPRCWCWRSFS
jgi:hypothetical protein